MTNRLRNLAIPLLGAAWLVCADANAQAHGPPATEFLDQPEPDDPVSRAERLSEMGAFLQRLVGRFRETAGKSNYSERMADCTQIGTGPGVQCMFGLESRSNTGGGTSALLFGLDPVAQRVNFLRVNAKSIAEGGLGKMSGDTLTLKFPCNLADDAPVGLLSCDEVVQFYTLEGSKEVAMTTDRIMRGAGGREIKITRYNWLRRMPSANGKADEPAAELTSKSQGQKK